MSGHGQKAGSLLRSLTIEPVTVLFYLANSFQLPTDDALWYTKVCLQLYSDEKLCENINVNESYAEMEKEVQSMNSEWNFYRNVCFSLPAIVTTFLYGSWSDRISRKLPMLLPLFGLLVGCSINMANAIFITSSLGFLLMSSALQGMLGGMLTMLMSTMSYISDISSPESRTFRISVLYASTNIGSLLAYTLSGVIFDHTGFIAMYSLCLGFAILSIFCTFFFVRDIKPEHLHTEDSDKKSEDLKASTAGVKTNCGRYCDISHAKEAFLVTFQRRENNHRVHIVAILVILLFYMIGGSTSIQYLYLKHPPLSFSQTLYGFYEGWAILIRLTVNGLFVPVLKKRFHVPDLPLLIIGLISHAMSTVVLALSAFPWMVFLVPLVAYTSYGMFTFMRSVISSMVRTDELGKIFAVFAVLENIGNILATALYSYFLYPQTIDIFAGFCYVFQSFIMLIPTGIAVWLLLDLRKRRLYGELEEELNVQSDVISLPASPPGEEPITGDTERY